MCRKYDELMLIWKELRSYLSPCLASFKILGKLSRHSAIPCFVFCKACTVWEICLLNNLPATASDFWRVITLNNRLWYWVCLMILSGGGLLGCSDQPWNDPHPEGESRGNVIYSSFSDRPKHLDPVRAYSADESRFIDQIYDPPLQFHYLKRPYELEPNTLTQMPTVTYLDEEGNPVDEYASELAFTLYVLEIKPGILYQPHPAFAKDEDGQPLYRFVDAEEGAAYRTLEDFKQTGTRELVADDYIYQLKRLADPKNLSPIRGLLTPFIVGMDDFAAVATETRKQLADPKKDWLDLNQLDLEGVQKLDDYRYQIKIKGKYPQFKYWLAFHFLAPVPSLVDEFYHQPGLSDRNIVIDWHPVGTGPFMMTRNDPNEVIVLERNPNYREDLYPTEGDEGDKEMGFLEDAGKPLPLLDKAVYRMEKEDIPRWIKFLQGYYDRSGIGSDSFDQAVSIGPSGTRLTQELEDKGISLEVVVMPGTYYLGFNMLDPVVGAQSIPGAESDADPKALAKAQERARKLRQAIAIAYLEEESISIFSNGRGEVANGPIPPGIFGYQSGEQGLNPYVYDWVVDASGHGKPVRKSLEQARQLLAEAGYPDGRDAETGEPLVLNLDTPTGGGATSARQLWMIKQFKNLGIQLNIRGSDYNRFKEKMKKGNAQIFQWGWLADYPDAENFLFLLASANGQVITKGAGVNSTNFSNPEYDALFDRMKLMPDSPERMELIRQMLDIYHRELPWASAWHPHSYVLNNPWVRNAKAHGISKSVLKYMAVDSELRSKAQQERNQRIMWPLLIVLLIVIGFMVPGYRAYRKRQMTRVLTGETGGMY